MSIISNEGRGTGDLELRSRANTWKSLSVLGAILLPSLLSWLYPFAELLPVAIRNYVMFGAVTVIIGTTAWICPRMLFYSLIFICIAFPHALEAKNLSLGIMKLYFHDIVYLALYCTTGIQLLRGKIQFPQLPFSRLVVAYVVMGLVATAIGLWYGNKFANAFGDFRRSFFYFTAFFFPLLLTRNSTDVEKLVCVMFAGSLTLIMKGFLQLGTDAFEVRRVGDAAHVLTHFEGTFITLAVYWAILKLIRPSKTKLIWMVIAAAGTVMVGLTNFRSCWIALTAGLLAIGFLLPPRHLLKVLGTISVIAMVSVIAMAALWKTPVHVTKSSIGDNILAKVVANSSVDQNIQWRLDSYKNALTNWKSHPVMGTGLGEHLQFRTRTSTGGSMIVSGHRVHNSYLWLFMSLGVIGFVLFAYVHMAFVTTLLKSIKVSAGHEQLILISHAAFYTAVMTLACFDVCLESTPPIILLGTIMGLSLLVSQNLVIFQKTLHHGVPVSPR